MAESKNVLCPECETETKLEDGQGNCPKCGLDVGWCLEKRRRDRAVKKLEEREITETPIKEKKGFRLPF